MSCAQNYIILVNYQDEFTDVSLVLRSYKRFPSLAEF